MNDISTVKAGDVLKLTDEWGDTYTVLLTMLGSGYKTYFDGSCCDDNYDEYIKYGFINLNDGRVVSHAFLKSTWERRNHGILLEDLMDKLGETLEVCLDNKTMVDMVYKMDAINQEQKRMSEALALFNHPTMLSLAASRF
jgi:hypothetical protein